MEMDGTSGHMDHHHGSMTMTTMPSSTSTNMQMQKHMHHHHMTFFWGKDVEVLFSGFPGDRGLSLYLLSLALVLLAALLVEALSATSRRLLSPSSSGLLQATLHAARVGLAYLVMLAAMSFNAGVFLAAVAGHGLGFLLFSSSASLWARPESDEPAGKP